MVGIIFNTPSTQFIYYNNLYIDTNGKIDQLYVTHIPNISTQLISTEVNNEISSYYIYYYPELSTNYYRSTVNNPSTLITSGKYLNLFKSNISAMYTSIENLINDPINSAITSYIINNTLSCYLSGQTFSYTYISGNLEHTPINNNYINLYFTTSNSKKIGIFTLFIRY